MSSQKKRRIREKDAENHRQQRLKKSNRKDLQGKDNSSIKQSQNLSATKQAAYRAKQKLPKDSQKFAQTISYLLNKASPRKRQEMKKLGLFKEHRMENKIHATTFREGFIRLHSQKKETGKQQRRILARALHICRKYRLLRKVSDDLKISRKFLSRYTRTESEDVSRN